MPCLPSALVRFRQPGALLGLVALLGCASSGPSGGDGDPDLAVTLVDQDAWAGGPVRLRSDRFEGTGPITATLRVGATELPLERMSATEVRALLPSTASGQMTALLKLGSEEVALPGLTVYGYEASHAFNFNSVGGIHQVSRAAPGMLMTQTRAGLIRFDLVTKVVDTVPVGGRVDAGVLPLRDPGATPVDGVWLLQESESSGASAWDLRGIPQKLDARRFLADGGPKQQLVQFGSGTFAMIAGLGQLYAYHRDSPLGQWALMAEENVGDSYGLILSPRGDRATMRGGYAHDGIPVLRATDGGIAFRLEGLRYAAAAGFTGDGAVLAVGGRRRNPNLGQSTALQLLDAASGVVLRDTTLGKSIRSLAFDPVRPLLFVEVDGASASRSTVLVFDRTTMRKLGEMAAPDDALFGGGTLTVGPGNALFVTQVGKTPTQTVSLRFSLPAGSGIPPQ